MFQQYKIQKEKQNSAVYKKKLSSTKNIELIKANHQVKSDYSKEREKYEL